MLLQQAWVPPPRCPAGPPTLFLMSVCMHTRTHGTLFIMTTLFSQRDAWRSSTNDVFHIYCRRDNKERAMRKEEKREGDGKGYKLPYWASAYTQRPTTLTSKEKERRGKKMHALSFFFPQDGLYGLIRTQVPPYLPSSCIVCIHTQIQLTAPCPANTTHFPLHTCTNKSGWGWFVHRCLWQTNIKHNHRLSGQFRPHSVAFPHGPVRAQVSSSQNLVVKVNLSQHCKGVWKPVVKLLSEVSGMRLHAAVRFNMAASVCSHHWQDVFPFFCLFFFSFSFLMSDKRFTCAPLYSELWEMEDLDRE